MDAFFDKFAKIPIFQKVLGFVLVCLLVIGLYYFFVHSAQKQQQEEIRNSIISLEASLEEKKKMVGDLSQYKREVEKLNQDLQKALKLLPNSSEIPSLLQKVSSLAKKAGLDILSFQPKPEIPQDFYARVPVSLKLSGSYNELTNFFDAVGKLSRIVNISNFSFGSEEGGRNANKQAKKVLSAECIATTYRFIPPSKPAGTDAQTKGKK